LLHILFLTFTHEPGFNSAVQASAISPLRC